MQFIYGDAPLKYNSEGIPTHKAGEWPGLLSCKFHSYKKVIHPVNSGIIFNEKEPPLVPRRKLLGASSPTPEYIFKPCLKMVPEPGNHSDRPEGLRYIPFPSRGTIPRPERRHTFPYRIEMDREEDEKNKRMTNANAVRNEFRLMGLVGFAKKPYEGIPYKCKPGGAFNRTQLNSIRMDDYEDEKNMTKRQKFLLERKKKLEERKNYNNDIKYVENLCEWEKKILNKPLTQPVSQPVPANPQDNPNPNTA